MVGVCIKFFHDNYGGVLQSYATTAMLEKMGLEYELIRYGKKRSLLGIVKSFPRLLNHVLLNDKYEGFLKKLGMKMHPEFAANNAKRTCTFKNFKESHFTKCSPVYEGYEELCRAGGTYSSVLVGSDQLWSPAGLPTNYYNLMFVPQEVCKVSWASSFGVSEIPWYQKRRTRDYLNRIQHISMRENRGAEIVKELTGKEVPVLMDPVFVFDQEEWDALVERRIPEWEDYIFCYFLGNNQEHRQAAKELARKTGLKIVTLRHLDRYIAQDEMFGDYAPYDVGPDRFLNILRNAKYVCTDSFHGSAFSIIYEKQFVVFDRYSSKSKNSKNSRIDSLCANLNLSERRYETGKDIAELMQKKIDYAAVKRKLSIYQERTKEFLKNTLS